MEGRGPGGPSGLRNWVTAVPFAEAGRTQFGRKTGELHVDRSRSSGQEET